MLRLPLILICIIVCSSCTRPTGIKDLVVNSDSAAINFYKGDGSMDTVTRVVIVHNKKKLDSIAAFMESDQVTARNCGYDGSIHFFRENRVIQDVDFRMNEAGCMNFSFRLEGKPYQTKLSKGAREFLGSVTP